MFGFEQIQTIGQTGGGFDGQFVVWKTGAVIWI
jgi:hypothetical protein